MNENIIKKNSVEEICNYFIKKMLGVQRFNLTDASSVYMALHKDKTYLKYNKLLEGKELLIEEEISKKDFNNFILKINPFFKSFDEKEKYTFYLKSYFFCKIIYDNTEKVLNERKVVSFYKILDITNRKYVETSELFDVPLPLNQYAFFSNKKEALKFAKIYATAYIEFKVPLELQIEGCNSLHEVLETFKESFNQPD